jgi:hypothetical protein
VLDERADVLLDLGERGPLVASEKQAGQDEVPDGGQFG